jgi:predicted Zn-dependent peptidase
MLFQGYYYISTEVSPELIEPTIEEIYKEMRLLREKEISKEELEMNRNYMLGNLLTAVDGPFQSIRIVKSAILNGEKEEDLERTIQTFVNIDAKELKATAEQYLDPSDFIEVLIG